MTRSKPSRFYVTLTNSEFAGTILGPFRTYRESVRWVDPVYSWVSRNWGPDGGMIGVCGSRFRGLPGVLNVDFLVQLDNDGYVVGLTDPSLLRLIEPDGKEVSRETKASRETLTKSKPLGRPPTKPG